MDVLRVKEMKMALCSDVRNYNKILIKNHLRFRHTRKDDFKMDLSNTLS